MRPEDSPLRRLHPTRSARRFPWHRTLRRAHSVPRTSRQAHALPRDLPALAIPVAAILLASLLVAAGLLTPRLNLAHLSSLAAGPAFTYTEIDAGMAGDVKLVGDLDGDGFGDLVVGGSPGEGLVWYRYTGWQRSLIARPETEFTTDGALGDVDGDGDLDIVVPDGDRGSNLKWFENPRPAGDPGSAAWIRHDIGAVEGWGKDVHLADFDGDGRMDVASRNGERVWLFFQEAGGAWARSAFGGPDLGREGMASGDIDADGHVDLVLRGTWRRNPGGAAAREGSAWISHAVGSADSDFKALVFDLDRDGRLDLLFSSSENRAPVDWWSHAGDPQGPWTRHEILPSLDRAHSLQAGDLDGDGDPDLLLAQMHTGGGAVYLLYNADGRAGRWERELLAESGIHNGVLADIGLDGDIDIFGANWTGNPPVKLWENQLNPRRPLDRWTYVQLSDQHAQTFGLAFGDVDRDGLPDIVSGPAWYRNPGGDLLGDWTQTLLPAGMHACLNVDIDGDARSDLIAQRSAAELEIYWLEATDAGGRSWSQTLIGRLPRASHELGAQGYKSGQLEPGGRPEIVLSSGQGIYYFRVPAEPETGAWPRLQVSALPSDEGLALGDIDRDGQLDVAATTGDAKGLLWFRNPGDGSADWAGHTIGRFDSALYPDRTELADLNRDGRLDIVVTEENGAASDAQTYWWAQPADPTRPDWPAQLVHSQGSSNSLDLADMDGDGDTDLILAEHRGALKLSIWANEGPAGLSEHIVGRGRESHLGARAVDLDLDGDQDIVSIAYDAPRQLHLWRNDALDRAGGAPTPEPRPTEPEPPLASPSPTRPEPTPPGPTPTPPEGPIRTATPPDPRATPCCGRSSEGLILLYRFDEGGGDRLLDSAGQGPPLNLDISDPDAVTWLPEGGLRIDAASIIRSAGPASKLIDHAVASHALTLEAWFEPADSVQEGPARILSLSQDPFLRNLSLGQEFDRFDLRLRSSASTDNGMPSLVTASGTAGPSLQHLVFTRAASGAIRVYLAGQLALEEQRGGDLSNWDASFPLALGNELSLDRPWLGTLQLIAVYDRALGAEEVERHFRAGARPIRPGGMRSQSYIPLALSRAGWAGAGALGTHRQ